MTELTVVSQLPATSHNVSGANSDSALIAMFIADKGSGNTKAAYRLALDGFFALVGDVALQSVTVAHLQAYKAHLEQTASPATARLRVNAVKSLLTFAQTTGYLQFNPGAVVKATAAPSQLAQRIVSEETIYALLAAPERPRDKLLLRLLYVTGCRLSEAIGLNWRDIATDGRMGYVTVLGKGSKPRTITVSLAFAQLLLAARGSDGDDQPVFTSQKGNRLSDTAAWAIVKKAGNVAGVPNISPHWLRHAHATHSLARGADLIVVSATLGHSGLNVTQRYLHVRPDESSALHLAI